METKILPLNYAPKESKLFGFFVYGALFAPLAVFFKFYLPLHFFLVFAAVIVDPLALGALKLY